MILLLGASGYVGQAYQRYFTEKGVSFVAPKRTEFDYTDGTKLRDLIRAKRPEFLINCAGYTGKPNVDACESHKAECLFGNAVLPGRIAEICASENLPWGHISSGCIFTGSKENSQGFAEIDPPNFSFRQNNCSFYSGTKALGEEALGCCVSNGIYTLHPSVSTYVWRLRIPFENNDNPRNYLSKLLHYERLLDARNSLSHLEEYVHASWECWIKRVPYGIYNLTNPESITALEVTKLFLDENQQRLTDDRPAPFKSDFHFFKDEAEFMLKAAITPRSNCVLDSSKLQRAAISMTPVQEKIKSCLRTWKS